MKTSRRSLSDGRGGTVSAVLALPDRPPAVTVVLAHGAGNDMENPLVVAVQEGLARRGYAAVRLNFPYKEKGGRRPDPAPVLEECYRSVLEALREDDVFGGSKLVIGGKSLGGRMASHLAAADEPVDGLLFLGYPLHPAGKPEKLRDAHLPDIGQPMLFLAGTRDSLCKLELLRPVLEKLGERATLHVVEGGDHSFRLPKSLGRTEEEIHREIIDASAAWLDRLF